MDHAEIALCVIGFFFHLILLLICFLFFFKVIPPYRRVRARGCVQANHLTVSHLFIIHLFVPAQPFASLHLLNHLSGSSC